MRPSVIVVSLGMLAACGGLAYVHAIRDEPETVASTASARPTRGSSIAAMPDQATTTANAGNASAGAETEPASPDSTDPAPAAPGRPDTVEQWIEDTRNSDPKIRAAAIGKLANAPKAQALPALQSVLETGDPEVDSHIALSSMHTLALRDGDEGGQIRDAMRSAIYHSDNDGVTQTAQSLLDDVEAALGEQQTKEN